MSWNRRNERLYRTEIERRFVARTPPQQPDEVDPGTRVVRSEMRTWARDTLGCLPPETDARWLTALARWYRAMARRVTETQS